MNPLCAGILARGLQADAGQLSLGTAEPLLMLWSLPCILDLDLEPEVDLNDYECSSCWNKTKNGVAKWVPCLRSNSQVHRILSWVKHHCVCVSSCVYIWEREGAHKCVRVHLETRDQHQVFSSVAHHDLIFFSLRFIYDAYNVPPACTPSCQ